MAIPPLTVPSSIRRHLGILETRNGMPDRLEAIREGIRKYSSDNPEVSIIIPAYNDGVKLVDTLSSIADLRLPDEFRTELLVVDDGSTDQTQELLQMLEVTHIRLGENSTTKVARQKGLESCRGEIVLQADADSVYPIGWGLQYIRLLQKHQDLSLVYGGHAFLPDPRTNRLSLAIHEALGNVARLIRRRHREYINVHGFNSAFRREDGLKYGSYDHDDLGSEDGEMGRRLSQVGGLKYCPQRSCRVWTSPRRLLSSGGLFAGSIRRIKKESRRLAEYLTGK